MTALMLRSGHKDGHLLAGPLAAGVIGLAPLATMLVSWIPSTEQAGPATLLIKGFAVPVLIAELFVILLTLSEPATRRPDLAAPSHYRLACLAFMVVAAGTAAFAAPDPVHSYVRTGIIAVHLLFGYSVFRLCKAGMLKPEQLTNGLIAGFAASFAALLLFGWQVRHVDFNWVHDMPGYVNIRNLAYYTAPMAALMLARLAVVEDRTRLAWNFACGAAAIGLIFWSGSRGALVALVGAYAVAALFFSPLRAPRAWMNALLAGLVGFLAAYMIGSPTLGGMGIERMTESQALTTGRTDLWMSSIAPILERPWFGYGEGQTIHVVPYAQTHRIFSAHNIVLQTLLAWGLVGTLLIAGLAWALARRVIAAARSGGELLPPALAAMTIAAYSLIDGTLYYVLTTAIFAACVGLLVAAPSTADRDAAATAS
ncbi:MAG TPA: O-antigen ligase family protein [Tepidisphaeraceae bacterium]|jgi:O-antigen ligase